MVKAPHCRLCGKPHWSTQPCSARPKLDDALPAGVTKGIDNMPLESQTNVTTSVTRRGFGSGSGRRKMHKNPGARQRAYRKRKSNGQEPL